MLCVDASILDYLSCLVGNILANFNFDKLWFTSNGGAMNLIKICHFSSMLNNSTIKKKFEKNLI